jgi:hypothetical protein
MGGAFSPVVMASVSHRLVPDWGLLSLDFAQDRPFAGNDGELGPARPNRQVDKTEQNEYNREKLFHVSAALFGGTALAATTDTRWLA